MHAKLKPLSQQVIVITGASSGIGLAAARKAAAAGAAVVLTSRNEEALRKLAEEINAAGGRAHPVAGDVGDPGDVEKIARAAIARFGGFDTWVNGAGVGLYGKAVDTPPEDHERLFRTNYFGVVNGSVEAVRRLRARPGGGAIINVGSVTSDIALPLQGAYSASKHAVKGFTDALRLEMIRARTPISVTLVTPGGSNSPFADHARNYMDQPARVPPPVYAPEVVADAILHAAQHPVRRLSVGSARQMALAASMAPGLSDRLLAAVIPPLSRRKGAKLASDNLHAPGVDGHARTDAFGGRGFSVSTAVQKHPGVALGLGVLAAAGVAAWLGRGALARTARPLVARAARPLVIRAAARRPLIVARYAARHPQQAARIAAALR